ncbi:hypothetical protein D1872_259120 [compost metagenome]
MISETEQIQLQRLALHHFDVRNIADINGGEIRLSRDRTEARKFRTVKLHEIVPVRVLVIEAFQHLGRVSGGVLDPLIAEQGYILHLFRFSS